jgi:hypothetical protein
VKIYFDNSDTYLEISGEPNRGDLLIVQTLAVVAHVVADGSAATAKIIGVSTSGIRADGIKSVLDDTESVDLE